ncbi:MAG: glycoside hydrolase family 127 protein [Planctomycetaceae bacterium]|jgi:DUF1680 family protein|nr:glycoside hydrolase family 127 protein [Planctomycetaceae bacterium]
MKFTRFFNLSYRIYFAVLTIWLSFVCQVVADESVSVSLAKLNQASTGWVKHPDNPVIRGNQIILESVVDDNGTFKAWLDVRAKRSIGYAESKDGVHWSDIKIVLSPVAGTWEEFIVDRPYVVKKDGLFYMWYTVHSKAQKKQERHTAAAVTQIAFATSTDGINWKRMSDKPVLVATEKWENESVMCPVTIWDEEEKVFKMWYSAGGAYEPTDRGYATSKDGLNWTKHKEPVFSGNRNDKNAWDHWGVAGGTVLKLKGEYYLFYIGYKTIDYAQTGMAKSKDGIVWERSNGNPIVSPSEDYDKLSVYITQVIYRENEKRWYLWYSGRNKTELPCLATYDSEEPKLQANYKFRAVPFTAVKIDDNFWSPRLKTNREISIPHNYKWCEDTGRITNFAKAAKILQGDFEGIYYNDSDVYKILEGTAYSLASHPDSELEKRADDVIAWIAAAQMPNGYLNSYFSLREQNKKWTQIHKHELYCAGHLLEAAVAYKQATGKDTLLNVAEKLADHIYDVFYVQKSAKFGVPGCEEIELALIKLYQQTGKEKYLTLSKHFIDVRGDQLKRQDKLAGVNIQDHLPVRKQFEIVGHAVRACYFFTGVADVAAYSGDKELLNALDNLWNDTVNRKMYITGGIGATHGSESFGAAYELPNKTAYCETCAAISLAMWAHRMNLLHGDAKYADVIERAAYNNILAGYGMDGKSFFYVNPLEAEKIQPNKHDVTKNVLHHRQPFFTTACCPTNVVRFIPSLSGYQYAVDKDGVLIVNQYFAGNALVELPNGTVKIKLETNYPCDGKLKFKFESTPKPYASCKTNGNFVVKFRIPSWSRDQIFGEGINVTKIASGSDGYTLPIEIAWGKSFVRNIDFKMETNRVIAHPKVVANNGRVAIQRGPLVYCFEETDNKALSVFNIELARDPQFKEEFQKDLLGGIVVLKCKDTEDRELTAVPYYAWDNREMGAMNVWVNQQGLSKSQPISTTNNQLYNNLKPEILRPDL